MNLGKILSALALPLVLSLMVAAFSSAIGGAKVSSKTDPSMAAAGELALSALRTFLLLLHIGIAIWFGYRASKKYKLGFSDIGVGAAIMGLANAAVTAVIILIIVAGVFGPLFALFGLAAQGANPLGGLFVGALGAFMAGFLLVALFVLGIIGTIFTMLYALIGAWAAKRAK